MREWLEAARSSKGLTQAEMAKRLDVSESYYSLIERGERQKKMDVTLVAKISAVLGIPLSRIVEYETKGG